MDISTAYFLALTTFSIGFVIGGLKKEKSSK